MRVIRGTALAEPFLGDDAANDDDAPAGADSPLSQSSIQGSVFFPPDFAPTINQDNPMLKSYTGGDYNPPSLSMSMKDRDVAAPSPSMILEKS